ncbi:hypothetical protein ACIBO2_36155 [Nonomuraea sp. NPDC050022]|uniref:hypothetical protein n=1 Tax=unclassified Nonomuraea TaxID=2593643 RepID=UPI0033DC741F
MALEEDNPTLLPEIPDFDVWQAGKILRGRHRPSGRLIEADTSRRLVLLASAVRIGADPRRVIP